MDCVIRTYNLMDMCGTLLLYLVVFCVSCLVGVSDLLRAKSKELFDWLLVVGSAVVSGLLSALTANNILELLR